MENRENNEIEIEIEIINRKINRKNRHIFFYDWGTHKNIIDKITHETQGREER